MYTGLKHTHSLLRWFLLITLVLSVLLAIIGVFAPKTFSKIQNKLRSFTVIFAHIQLVIGLVFYVISPFIKTYYNAIGTGMKDKTWRYFAVEHSLLMIIAVVLITIGSAKAKRKTTDADKHKTIAIWFTIALLVILYMIPWPGSAYPRGLFPGM